jgi:hypothetical protein
MLHILNQRALEVPRFVYVGLKAIPSMLWCALIPFQHNDAVRKWWPGLHRFNGYAILLLSLDLGLTGFWMLNRGMSTTHKDFFHIHTFYGLYLPILAWPTFEASLWILGPAYFYSMMRVAESGWLRDYEVHRKWSVFHTVCGYAIAIERVVAVAVNIVGWILTCLPLAIQTDLLRIPQEPAAKADVELAALAWTNISAGYLGVYWIYHEWSKTTSKNVRSGKGVRRGRKLL